MSKPLLIIETGHAFDEVLQQEGDFSDLIIKQLPKNIDILQVNVIGGETLPDPTTVSGAVVTGSHSMVSDKEAWSEYTAEWLRQAVSVDLPILGICYGHQLLAHALGGQADYNPNGVEVGTKAIFTTENSQNDPIFSHLPNVFDAHATHLQSALKLPKNATILAFNEHDKHHAFRVGRHVWGVQFHPEMTEITMSAYAKRRAKDSDLTQILNEIKPTPLATQVLYRFGQYANEQSK